MTRQTVQNLLIAAAAAALAACAGESGDNGAETTPETEAMADGPAAEPSADGDMQMTEDAAPDEEQMAAPSGAADDPVTGMCLYYNEGEEAACACATDRFREAEAEADSYAAIASAFLSGDASLSTSARWQQAVETAAADEGRSMTSLLTLSNTLGKAHREAMKACGL